MLNRHPDLDDHQQTVHVLRHIFPRQYGLHNVFTSVVDRRETTMPFKDYTLREKEIHNAMCCEVPEAKRTPETVLRWKQRVPKRLRGTVVELVRRLRKLHHKCSYTELLRHYCPVEGLQLSSKPVWRTSKLRPRDDIAMADGPARPEHEDGAETVAPRSKKIEEMCFTDMACPTAHVSAFCRAVLARIIPRAFWGGDSNARTIMFWVDQFVCLRRFESLTLHQVTENIQVRLPSMAEWRRITFEY